MSFHECYFKGTEDFYFLRPVKFEGSIDGGETFRTLYSAAAVVDGVTMGDVFGHSKKQCESLIDMGIAGGKERYKTEYTDMLKRHGYSYANH